MLLRFHKLAELELYDAADYYERESPGLGLKFLHEARRGLDFIASFPESAVRIEGHVRRRNFAKFPYAFLYTFSVQDIRVLAVMNQKRRPAYWHDRR